MRIQSYISSRISYKLPTTHYKLSRGFTLVETLVAVTIFAVSLTAIISVTAEGISHATNVKNRLTATYLAQEEIEYIRSLRLAGPLFGWSGGMVNFINNFRGLNTCDLGEKCVILSTHTPLAFPVRCLSADCSDYSMYRMDPTLGGYIYSDNGGGTGNALVFNRYVTLTLPVGGVADDQLIVTATVNWIDRGGAEKTIILTETLTDWIPIL